MGYERERNFYAERVFLFFFSFSPFFPLLFSPPCIATGKVGAIGFGLEEN